MISETGTICLKLLNCQVVFGQILLNNVIIYQFLISSYKAAIKFKEDLGKIRKQDSVMYNIM